MSDIWFASLREIVAEKTRFSASVTQEGGLAPALTCRLKQAAHFVSSFLCGEIYFRMSSRESKQAQFKSIIAEAAQCTLCPAMCGRTAVLSELNGSIQTRIMFIGEAPGRK